MESGFQPERVPYRPGHPAARSARILQFPNVPPGHHLAPATLLKLNRIGAPRPIRLTRRAPIRGAHARTPWGNF